MGRTKKLGKIEKLRNVKQINVEKKKWKKNAYSEKFSSS